VSDSDLIIRLGPEGTHFLKRARALRAGSSLAFVGLPIVLFSALALFRLGPTLLVVVALVYIVLGIPALIVVLVTASKDATRAARAAGSYLHTARYVQVEAIPKALLRMPVEGVDSWLAVNHVPNPARPASASNNPSDIGQSESTEKTPNSARFQARWTGIIIGGSVALLGVLFALTFVAVQVASLVSPRSAGSSSMLLIVACLCCFAVGLPVMYGSTRKIAAQRAQWYQNHDPVGRARNAASE
jgi:hypothetical protein